MADGLEEEEDSLCLSTAVFPFFSIGRVGNVGESS